MSLPIASLRAGKTVVATAGTRVQVADVANAKTIAVTAVIQALSTNTGAVAIGGNTVVAGPGTQGTPTQVGIRLNAGDVISLDLIDIGAVYVDAVTNGDGVSWVLGAA